MSKRMLKVDGSSKIRSKIILLTFHNTSNSSYQMLMKSIRGFLKLVLGLNEFVNIVERQGYDQIFNG